MRKRLGQSLVHLAEWLYRFSVRFAYSDAERQRRVDIFTSTLLLFESPNAARYAAEAFASRGASHSTAARLMVQAFRAPIS